MKRSTWIALILLAVVVAGVALWSLQEQGIVKQMVPVRGDAHRKVHASPAYGFSFAYPDSWQPVQNSNVYHGPHAVELIAVQDMEDNFESDYRLLIEVVPKSKLQIGVGECTAVLFSAEANAWIEVKDASFGKETDSSSGVCPGLVHSERPATPNAMVGNAPAYFSSWSLRYLVPLSGDYGLQISMTDKTDERLDQNGDPVVAPVFKEIVNSFEIR